MGEDEDRSAVAGREADWRAAYLSGADAVAHLGTHYGLSEDQAWERLFEKHEEHSIEGRYAGAAPWPAIEKLRLVWSKKEERWRVRFHRASFFHEFPSRLPATPELPDDTSLTGSSPTAATKTTLPTTELKAELRRRAEEGKLKPRWLPETVELERWADVALHDLPHAAGTIRKNKELKAEYDRLRAERRD